MSSVMGEFGSCIPSAMGRSYGDVALPATDGIAIKTRWLDRILDFDPQNGTVAVEAGVTLETLIDVFLPMGWFLPVTPGTRFVSVGGAVAGNIHGKNHHKCGAFVSCVEQITLLTPAGLVTCSRDDQPDVFFATAGGYGLTGLILTVRLKLRKVETNLIAAKFIKVRDLDEALDLDLANEKQYEYSVTWLDALAGPGNLGRGMLMLGNHASADFARSAGLPINLQAGWSKAVTAPPGMPGFFLNKASNLALNTAYANRFLGKTKEAFVGIESWFYPLDRVRDWHRFYGKSGFVEFQCSLPATSARQGMKKLLAEVRRSGNGSFLAVYKRIGHDGSSMPFAIPGFTLAMDFGLRSRGVLELMAKLIKIVREHGGRIYLSKDACMQPEDFHDTYPEFSKWNSVREQLDPSHTIRSRMSERLRL